MNNKIAGDMIQWKAEGNYVCIRPVARILKKGWLRKISN